MMMKRVLGAAAVATLVGSLGVVTACSAPPEDEALASSAQAISGANVSLVLHDESGAAVGTGSGILIAPRLVLTSAHLIAGKGRWTVTAADGKTKVNGTRGLTYDWLVYNSLKSHPRKHDVGVIYLDKPINLPVYPKLASKIQDSGTKAIRVRGTQNGFETIPATLEKIRSFPNAYVTTIPDSESLDTGGAVVNAQGEIVGLVTGRGMTTGKLYVARVTDVVAWLAPKVVCGGGSSSNGLSVQTYGKPQPKPGCEKDGGTSGGGGNTGGYGGSGSGSGDGSNDGSDGSGDGSGSGSGSGSGDGSNGGTCSDGGGNCSGDCSGSGSGGNSGSNSGGSNNGSSNNGSGDNGSGTGGGGGSGDGSNNGSSNNGSGDNGSGDNGSGTGGGGGSGDGSNNGSSNNGSGDNGSGTGGGGGSANGGNSGSSDGANGGTSGGAGGDEEACQGEDDTPEICPPEKRDCVGVSCGGATTDPSTDYGNCACTSSGSGGGPIILR